MVIQFSSIKDILVCPVFASVITVGFMLPDFIELKNNDLFSLDFFTVLFSVP